MNKSAPVTKDITDAASRISATDAGLFSARLYYNDGANTVFIGIDNTVTASGANKGYPIAPGAQFCDDSHNETWAICAAGLTSKIIVFSKGQ